MAVSGRRCRPIAMATKPTRQRGIALVIVLWVVTLLSIMAGSFAYSVRTETRLSTFAMERSQARALAEAGIVYAISKVMFNPSQDETWPTEGSARQWRFGRGKVDIAVIDTSGKIDINHAERNLLVGMFVYVGLEQEQAEALVDKIEDYRDADDLRRINGAEEPEYRDAGYPVGPKNALFESTEELQQVLDITLDLYQRVRPLITVYSNQPGVNPAAASEAVLNAVPDTDPQEIADYIALRDEAIEQELPLPPPPDLGPYLSGGRGLAYHISVAAQLDTGTKTRVESVVLRGRRADRLYSIAAWRER